MGFGQTIPQNNVYAAFEDQFEELLIAVSESVKTAQYVLGTEVVIFEHLWANYVGAKECVACASGTDALVLSLLAYGIGKGHEVITVGNAGVPTINAILQVGAKPVIVDVNDHLLMDTQMVKDAITPSTTTILPVHLYGNVCDMFNINTIAFKHRFAVIEDCAQAHGAPVGKPCGAWSFYPTKNLGAFGDAGAITLDDIAMASRLRKMRQYGWDNDRSAQVWGINSRMDAIQAAVLSKKLETLEAQNWCRKQIVDRYIRACDDFEIDYVSPSLDSPALHQFVLLVDDRDDVIAEFNRYGIRTAVHYELPVYEHPYYRGRVRVHSFVKTDYFCNRVLSLPLWPQMSDEQVERVCDVIKSIRSGAMPCTSRVFT